MAEEDIVETNADKGWAKNWTYFEDLLLLEGCKQHGKKWN
jgi:hypothetical protein